MTVPQAVLDELDVGRTLGLDVPDVFSLNWVTIRSPINNHLPLTVAGLGRGETEVLLLALEAPAEIVVILDDVRARSVAEQLGLQLTGTLGLLLDAKRAGLVPEVAPLIDRLQALGFRLAKHTHSAVLKLAGEIPH